MNTVYVYLYIERYPDGHPHKSKGWEVFDESGNVTEGPFRTREEATKFVRDLKLGRMQLSGSARYHDAQLERQYQEKLAKWRKRNP
jgi:hypothetical protein